MLTTRPDVEGATDHPDRGGKGYDGFKPGGRELSGHHASEPASPHLNRLARIGPPPGRARPLLSAVSTLSSNWMSRSREPLPPASRPPGTSRPASSVGHDLRESIRRENILPSDRGSDGRNNTNRPRITQSSPTRPGRRTGRSRTAASVQKLLGVRTLRAWRELRYLACSAMTPKRRGGPRRIITLAEQLLQQRLLGQHVHEAKEARARPSTLIGMPR